MFNRSFCIHGHFYQPPREDPLTGIIPYETGAAPFANWNERIHAECYRPNAELGNFERISFNIGPTLTAWMARYDPATLRLIVAQDRANVNRYGVGNAIAQAYNHTILPLSSYRDKVTQVAWGIAEFEHRFGRKPQGMWLPETAVDTETLGVLAEQGIEFTILAPWQANSYDLDPTEPYRVALPEGRSITVFFYHRELSSAVSFNPAITINADHFALNDLVNHFSQEKDQRGEPQFLLLASDGELYGHHQPQRDRFLARLVDGASAQAGTVPTFPGIWLREFRVRRTIGLHENTSWSCHHGVSRWLGNCACTSGNGRWKAHLRYALERLSGALDDLYQDHVGAFIAEPWEMRNQYIRVMLGIQSAEDFIFEMAGRRLPVEATIRIHMLLEAQRERQRMYTSCGWFFDDFDRIEPKNNLAYAAQAVRLTRLATNVNLEPFVMADLRRVVSQRTRLRADKVFRRQIKRAILDGRIEAAS